MPDQLTDATTWVSAAYPDGVPEQDAAALLAVLRSRLGDATAYRLAFDLAARGELSASAAHDDATAPDEEQLRRVSAQLVLGGWPLGALTVERDPAPARPADPEAGPGTDAEGESRIGRIVTWLRDGYPYGVPEHDYQPLLALLERRLTNGEVKKVARALRHAEVSPAGPDDIAAAIEAHTHVDASSKDLERVRAHLAKKGWPLDFPDPGAADEG